MDGRLTLKYSIISSTNFPKWVNTVLELICVDLENQEITNKGLYGTGMVNPLRQRYLLNGEKLDQLFEKAKPHIGLNSCQP